MALVSPKQAIDAYLEALLGDAAAMPAPVPAPAPGPTEQPEGDFACRLFEIVQLPFAVPNQFVSGAATLADGLPAADSWQAGMLDIEGDSRCVIDVARLVLPAAYQERLCAAPLAERCGQLLLTTNGLALAVDAVIADIRVESGAIRWRSAMGLRPWLAGMSMDPQAILLDTDWLARMAATGTNPA